MSAGMPPGVRQRTIAKARILLDALPYMREHFGRTVVVKLGGAALDDERLVERFAEDIALLRMVGVRPILVHGGGPQVSAMSERLGIQPRFQDGLRVTDAETLKVARMVLVGTLNKDLVGHVNRAGVPALGLCGEDGDLLLARALGDGLGFVGEIASVHVELLERLMEAAVPVIASLATDGRGQSYNVNADQAAASIAIAMRAAKLVLLTDVPGVVSGDELVSEMPAAEAETLIRSEVVTGGMVPKLRAAASAVQAGVERAHIIDGRVEHALLLELFTPEGMGTMLTRAAPAPPGVPGSPLAEEVAR